MTINQFHISPKKVSRIIGKGGKNIKQIQTNSEANIQIKGEMVTVRGTPSQCNFAERMIISRERNSPQHTEIWCTIDAFLLKNYIFTKKIPIAVQHLYYNKKKSKFLYHSILKSIEYHCQEELGTHFLLSWKDLSLLGVKDIVDKGIIILELFIQVNLPKQLLPLLQSEIITKSDQKEIQNGVNFFEENHSFRSRPNPVDFVTFVICTRINDNNHMEILLVLENTDLWFLPAGHLDPEENFAEGGIRETKEESGFDIEITSFVDVLYYLEEHYSALHCVVRGEIIGGELKIAPDHHTKKAAWFSIEEVIQDIGSGKQIAESTKNYRKPFEIGPIIQRFYNLVASGANLPFIVNK